MAAKMNVKIAPFTEHVIVLIAILLLIWGDQPPQGCQPNFGASRPRGLVGDGSPEPMPADRAPRAAAPQIVAQRSVREKTETVRYPHSDGFGTADRCSRCRPADSARAGNHHRLDERGSYRIPVLRRTSA